MYNKANIAASYGVKMKISRLEILGLFNRFNYDFDFTEQPDNVHIFHGHNGTGKTTILKIIHDIAKRDFLGLSQHEFSFMKIKYSNGTCLEFEKNTQDGNKKNTITFTNINNKIINVSSELNELTERELLKFEDFYIQSRKYTNILGHKKHEKPSKAQPDFFILFSELIKNAPKEISQDTYKKILSEYPFDTIPLINTKQIDTKRLDQKMMQEKDLRELSFEERHRRQTVNPLQELSKRIASDINSTLNMYATESQQSDSQFPQKIINLPSVTNEHVNSSTIEERLKNLKDKTNKLSEAGIFPYNTIIEPRNISDNLLPILEIYCDETEKKLNIFNDLYKKITTLSSIINNQFEYKEIRFNKNEGLCVFDPENDRPLSLEQLSSGEQHELFMFADLIFAKDTPDIIIVDEPEISLHVNWQQNFISNMLLIDRLHDKQLFIATHSPSIIGNRIYDAFDLNKKN